MDGRYSKKEVKRETENSYLSYRGLHSSGRNVHEW